ncbi:MAG: sigma 54-interacting transcriptional regulator [Geminicoccaceae bacterium]
MRLGAFDHVICRSAVPRSPISCAGCCACAEAAAGRLSAQAAEPETEELISASDAMRRVHKTIGLVADSDATVLITGETGTGKELVARAIHAHGRGAGPFVALHRAAVPAELLESALLGHARGAFLYRCRGRALGAFRDAQGGTLLPDEIGDSRRPPCRLQVILRVLQDSVVQPIGCRAVRRSTCGSWPRRTAIRGLGARGPLSPDLLPPPRGAHPSAALARAPPGRVAAGALLSWPARFMAGRRRSSPPRRRTSWSATPGLGNVLFRNAMERVAVLARGPLVAAADLAFLGGAGDGDAASGAGGLQKPWHGWRPR